MDDAKDKSVSKKKPTFDDHDWVKFYDDRWICTQCATQAYLRPVRFNRSKVDYELETAWAFRAPWSMSKHFHFHSEANLAPKCFKLL